MTDDPARMIELFGAIPPETIAEDLRAAAADLPAAAARIKTLRSTASERRTPEASATLAHWLMVQAHALNRLEHLAPEHKIFYATIGADEVMTAVEMASLAKGRLGQVAARMDAIRRREGLAEGDFFFRGEGPADYQELAAESERLFEKISGTVFAHLLRRYHLDEQAELFEKDPAEFEIQREIGRRALVGESTGMPEIGAALDTDFERTHGPAALLRVRQRVAELRAWAR